MKIPEVAARLFHRVFVCQKCKHKQKFDDAKVRAKKAVCRNCGAKCFRPKRKEKRAVV